MGRFVARMPPWAVLAGALALAVLGRVLQVEELGATKASTDLWIVPIGGLSLVGAGVYVNRRPDGRTLGLLLIACGYGYLAGDLVVASADWLFVIGTLLAQAALVLICQISLSYPAGRVVSSFDRYLLFAAYAAGFLLIPAAVLLDRAPDAADSGLVSNFTIADLPGVSRTLHNTGYILAGAVAAAIIGRLWERVQLAAPGRRQVLLPLYGVAAIYLLANMAFDLVAVPFASAQWSIDYARPIVRALLLVCTIAIPWAVLAGFFRLRLARGASVEALARLAPDASLVAVRDLLRETLGEPSLNLQVRLEGEWVEPGAERVSPVPEGAQVTDAGEDARLVHDPVLGDDPSLLEAVATAVGAALERRQALITAGKAAEDLAAARKRAVALADEARRRVERDLHDGAQQRLVSLSMLLGGASDRLVDADPELPALLARAERDATEAVRELRALAQGAAPPVLTDFGLRAALEELADTCPIDCDLDATIGRARLAPTIELTVYLIAAEAYTNALRHAAAGHIAIRLLRDNDLLELTVEDDGRGGALVGAGSGLPGLRDRVEAAGGTLTVTSPAGEGTTVHARVPLATPAPRPV